MKIKCQINAKSATQSELCDCESAQILQSTYVYIIAFKAVMSEILVVFEYL